LPRNGTRPIEALGLESPSERGSRLTTPRIPPSTFGRSCPPRPFRGVPNRRDGTPLGSIQETSGAERCSKPQSAKTATLRAEVLRKRSCFVGCHALVQQVMKLLKLAFGSTQCRESLVCNPTWRKRGTRAGSLPKLHATARDRSLRGTLRRWEMSLAVSSGVTDTVSFFFAKWNNICVAVIRP